MTAMNFSSIEMFQLLEEVLIIVKLLFFSFYFFFFLILAYWHRGLGIIRNVTSSHRA